MKVDPKSTTILCTALGHYIVSCQILLFDIFVLLSFIWFFSSSTSCTARFSPATTSSSVLNNLKTARLTLIQVFVVNLFPILPVLLNFCFSLVYFNLANLISYMLLFAILILKWDKVWHSQFSLKNRFSADMILI